MLVPLAALVLGMPVAVSAHEGHKENKSDAEMAQMESHDAAGEHDVQKEASHVTNGDGPQEAVAEQPTPEQALAAAIAENRATSAGDFLGRLHPIAAHFPIALLLMAALAELLLILRPSLALETTVRFLVAGGAGGAVIAALLGWFAAGWRLSDKSQTLGLHRWNGTAIAGFALVATGLAFRSHNRTGLRFALAVLAIALVAQGYLGGEMVFGLNHLGIR
ncbi:MAG: hypothetical protein BGO57_14855 [Sphingomonadales bacterium 63-6]|nr:MAG: hypothetical protein BGO57_14855 [Sphingomonadales bacterium 63-6]